MSKSLERDVIELWNEGLMPEDIAEKLGAMQDFIEEVIESEIFYKGDKDGNTTRNKLRQAQSM